MGRGRKHHAEGGVSSGDGEGPCGGVGGKVSVWRRPSPSGGSDFYGRGGAGDTDVRAVRSVFYVGGSPCPRGYERGGRVWGLYACRYIQPFRECGERVPVSPGICEPKTIIRPVDGYGKRRIPGRDKKKPCEDYGRDRGEDCGLWTEGFPEHGGVYGSCRV